MTSAAFPLRLSGTSRLMLQPLRWLLDRARQGDRGLVAYGALLLVLASAFSVGWLVDERTLRGANVWIKPFKFAIAIALLAFTTALFASVVERAPDALRALRRIRAALIAAGTFELAYIALQASLGEASHFNVADPVHGVMYALMGIGAIILTATQPALAWQIHRRASATTPPALRSAIVLGLVLTFVLGAGAGIPLSALPAVSNAGGLPILGWSLQGGDLRPAHFVGIHAGQVIPAFGAWLVWRRSDAPRARGAVRLFAGLWTTLFAVAFLLAFVRVPMLSD